MLIHILRPPDAQGQRLEDDIDESQLMKFEYTLDDGNEHTTVVEYCLLGCDGPAHRTRIAESSSHFCAQHVHRSGHVTIKQWPEGMGAAIGSF